MENPEEVLQALDEFQKMRPSEIPRELEEYLCWVAKTGDPVYQWSLVKPLFREKLTRVMTDFYESCPTLELAPCPNVDQFNYDNMKCALLELLDSFANAPFTVQRICELLTSPRKEYNRVDKFMRAIEKNILVVSTREPGPAARRSENGDGMVNGSVDDDALSSQSTHQVEMESWVKDCTTESTISVTAGLHSETPLLDSVITGKAPKIVNSCDESSNISQDKNESAASKGDVGAVTTSCHGISDTAIVVSPNGSTKHSEVCDTNAENSSETTTTSEAETTITDVPEAVINEDTSSQPSLDSEADETDPTAVSRRKLQTSFEPNDFVKEPKSPKLDANEPITEEDKPSTAETEPSPSTGCSNPSSDDSIEKSKQTVVPIVETVVEKRLRSETEDNDADSEKTTRHDDSDNGSPLKKACSEPTDKSATAEQEPIKIFNADSPKIATKSEEEIVKMDDDETIETSEKSDCVERLAADENIEVESEGAESKDAARIDCADDCQSEAERVTNTTEISRPIIEEPSFEESSQDSASKSPHELLTEQSESGVTIEEAMDDDTRVNKSIIPDPIPIVEEPKEATASVCQRDIDDSTTIITELPDDSKNVVENVQTPGIDVITETTVIEEPATGCINEQAPIVDQPNRLDDITDVRTSPPQLEHKIEPAESMEVDGDELLPVFQQDEPMEQEPGDLIKS